MERQSRVHLDHPTIRGRVREPQIRHARSQHLTDLHGRNPQPSKNEPTSASKVEHKPATAQASPQPVPSPVLRIRTKPMSVNPGKTAHMPRQARSGVLRRQMVRMSQKKFRAKKHRSYKPFMVAGIATFIIVIASFVGFLGVRKHQSGAASSAAVLAAQTTASPSDQDSGTSGNEMPSETNQPVDISGYTVGADKPRFLIIDKLGVNARVRRVGADNHDNIKGPSNIFDVGWYENSSEPGTDGAVVIDGHVSGETRRGVFYGLNTLKKGDKVIIERGDEKRISYTVVNTEQADFESLDIKKAISVTASGKSGLTLMTATGRFNVRTNQYEKRVVVYATQD